MLFTLYYFPVKKLLFTFREALVGSPFYDFSCRYGSVITIAGAVEYNIT